MTYAYPLIGYDPSDVDAIPPDEVRRVQRAAGTLHDRLGSIRDDLEAAIKEAGTGDVSTLQGICNYLADAQADLNLTALDEMVSRLDEERENDTARSDYLAGLGVTTGAR